MPLIEYFTARHAALLSLLVWWLNVALTTRWAAVPGSTHGARRPFFLAALVVLTVLAVRQRTWQPVRMVWFWRVACTAGAILLTVGFYRWLPPSTWGQIPFLDNWVPRYQSTIEQVALMRRGAMVGWNWWFLGGYQLSSDITQNLGVLAFPFVTLFGPPLGFHLLHLVLFAAVPVLVFLDMKNSDDREAAMPAAALASLLMAGYLFTAMRSGDTNSLAGVCTTTLTIFAMHAAYRRKMYGALLLVVSLTLAAYTHLGFFAYAVAYCALHCAYYRDWRTSVLLAASVMCAIIATLPVRWENWILPEFFTFNNVLLHPPESFQWRDFARQFYYNVEILFRPGRWFNDFTTPIRIFLPVTAFLAMKRRGRIGFYAWAALATLALMTLNYAEFGFSFSRPFHMLPVVTAPVLAGFAVRWTGSRALAASLMIALALYVSVVFSTVPHVSSVEQWNPELISRIRSHATGMVLLENSPHLNMIDSRTVSSPRTPFGVHFEPLLPGATGHRFYAGFWDGWQWSAFRENLLAAGAMWGRSLETVPVDDVVKELDRWGIQDVFVWTPVSQKYFASSSRFEARWKSSMWQHFTRIGADTRSVLTSSGSGSLVSIDALGAKVQLRDVSQGAEVLVRTNYYPVWSAYVDVERIPLYPVNGQMAFRAPRSGSYEVVVAYPRRVWLTALSAVGFVAGLAAITYWDARRRASIC